MNKYLSLSLALIVLPLAGHAQTQPASASSSAPMDHSMHDMHDMAAMPDMPATAHDHDTTPPPANADALRSPDYSDGIRASHMAGMHADPWLGSLRVNRLEAFDREDHSGQAWELAAWYGDSLDRATLRSEGERAGGQLDDGTLEALWSHAIATYWDTELGVRHDLGPGPQRDWLALGVSGLAPYYFELRATAYLGSGGRSQLGVSASYELRITQRLILEPELEAVLNGKNDPARGNGRGLEHTEFGLRLRYEIQRQFAPYLGVTWRRAFNQLDPPADKQADRSPSWHWVAGLRFWF
ncbi:MAG TPA: copper resistance protein B [Rhodanobacteraceae bacterium]|nr:copper resistance protein B [Rhodanobacteraceae bacterium]